MSITPAYLMNEMYTYWTSSKWTLFYIQCYDDIGFKPMEDVIRDIRG